MLDSDQSIREQGFVFETDVALAEQMIAERAEYDETRHKIDEFVGRPILSVQGVAVWDAVNGVKGYWHGNRFIKFLSRERIGAAIVVHAPREFDLSLLCSDCATEIAGNPVHRYVEVGPWYGRGRCWLKGWRVICPHL
jgi:hypothetical protein